LSTIRQLRIHCSNEEEEETSCESALSVLENDAHSIAAIASDDDIEDRFLESICMHMMSSLSTEIHNLQRSSGSSSASDQVVPRQSDLDRYLRPIIEQLNVREDFISRENPEGLPLRPSSMQRVVDALKEAASAAVEEFSASLEVDIDVDDGDDSDDSNDIDDDDRGEDGEDCAELSDVSEWIKIGLESITYRSSQGRGVGGRISRSMLTTDATKRNIECDVLSPFLGTKVNDALTSISLSSLSSHTSVSWSQQNTLRALLDSELLIKAGDAVEYIAESIGGQHSLIDRAIDYVAGGDYGEDGGGSIRTAALDGMSKISVDPLVEKFATKAAFLLGLPSVTRIEKGVCWPNLMNEGLEMILAFDIVPGKIARIQEIELSYPSTASMSKGSGAPVHVQVFGLPYISSGVAIDTRVYKEKRIFLGSFDVKIPSADQRGGSRYQTFTVAGGTNDDFNNDGKDDHSCIFDQRPAIQSVVFEFIADDAKDYTTLCIEDIRVIGDLAGEDDAPTCVG